jgi:hypothetical protein
MPPRLLVLSNGHGEDLIALRLIEALRHQAPDLEVQVLPLVGIGQAYAGAEAAGHGKAECPVERHHRDENDRRAERVSGNLQQIDQPTNLAGNAVRFEPRGDREVDAERRAAGGNERGRRRQQRNLEGSNLSAGDGHVTGDGHDGSVPDQRNGSRVAFLDVAAEGSPSRWATCHCHRLRSRSR